MFIAPEIIYQVATDRQADLIREAENHRRFAAEASNNGGIRGWLKSVFSKREAPIAEIEAAPASSVAAELATQELIAFKEKIAFYSRMAESSAIIDAEDEARLVREGESQ